MLNISNIKAVIFRIILSILTGILSIQNGNTQEVMDPEANNFTVPRLDELVKIPQSPQASAFQNYGNNSISLYTGKPDISVPLANLSGRDFSVPISLTYDASGIKVEQIATWVGLGWNLNVGGMITRNVNGLPDDYILASPSYIPFYSESSYWPDYQESVKDDALLFSKDIEPEYNSYEANIIERFVTFREKVNKGEIETQPDTYSFNVNGLSGTIFIDYDFQNEIKAFCIEHPDILVEPHFSFETNANGVRQLIGWTIIDKRGIQYLFSNYEITKVFDDDKKIGYRHYQSGWHLTSIVTPYNRDVVEFNYSESIPWSKEQIINAKMRMDVTPSDRVNGCEAPNTTELATGTYTVTESYLESIAINGVSRAFFELGNDRLDLSGKKSLKTVKIHAINGDLINTIELVRDDYFGNNDSELEYDKRLKLNAIRIFGDVITNNYKEYSFEYFESENVPPRHSMSQDYWGYYNGESNTTLIPINPELDVDGGFNGANRNPSLSHSKIGTLKRIVYPTGGATEYDYHLNSVFEPRTISNEVQLGGLVFTGSSGNLNCYDGSSIYPSEDQIIFTIDQSSNYRIKIDVGSYVTGDMLFVGLYSGPKQSFCELQDDQSIKLYKYQVGSNISSTEYTISLENVGSKNTPYNLIIASNINGSVAVSVTENRPQVENVFLNVGGLRIHKMVDYANESTIAQTKRFYYGDLSLSLNQIESSLFDKNSSSSGILHVKPVFEKIYPTQIFNSNDEIGEYFGFTCNYINRYSTNQSSWAPNHISYTTVTEIIMDGDNHLGYTVNEYHNNYEGSIVGLPYVKKELQNGLLKRQSVYDNSDNLLKEILNTYESANPNATSGIFGFRYTGIESQKKVALVLQDANELQHLSYISVMAPISDGLYTMVPDPCDLAIDSYEVKLCKEAPTKYLKEQYAVSGGWVRLINSKVTEYDKLQNRFIVEKNYGYSNIHFQQTNIQTYDSRNGVIDIFYSYPHDIKSLGLQNEEMNNLIIENRISEIVKTDRYVNNQPVSSKYIRYATNGNSSVTLPSAIQYSHRGSEMEDRIIFHAYDDYGNILHMSKSGDINMRYLWGYGNSLLVAKIEGSENNFAENIQTFDNDNLKTNLLSIKDLLNDSEQMTIYIHKPGYGVSEQIDANDLSTYYLYDEFGRLFQVMDNEGNILVQHEYKYADQNNTIE